MVVLDANVLFGYPLRDTLLRAAEAALYRPLWSEEIWDEVVRNLQDVRRKRPHTNKDVRHLLSEVRKTFPDSYVSGYQALIPHMPVNVKDKHIAATAVWAEAQMLVTYNTKHFLGMTRSPYSVVIQTPDEFLYRLFVQHRTVIVEIILAQAKALKNPPKTPGDVLADLEKVHVGRFARLVRSQLS